MCAPYYQVTEHEGHLRFTESRDYKAVYHAGKRWRGAFGIVRQKMPKDMDPYLLCSVLGTGLSDSLQLRLHPVSSCLFPWKDVDVPIGMMPKPSQ